MLNLVKTINGRLGDKQLEPETLDTVFSTYYPQFKKKFDEILSKTEATKGSAAKNTVIPSEQDMLEEVLITVRNLNQRVRRIENSSFTRNQHSTGKKYVLKEEIVDKIFNQYEPLFIHIVKNGKEYDAASLIKMVAEENGLPIQVARDIIQEGIKIKEMEYQESLGDTTRG